MRKHALIDKPQFGTGINGETCRRFKKKSDEGKFSTWVPELKVYMMLLPGTDVDEVAKKYKQQRDWDKKSLRH